MLAHPGQLKEWTLTLLISVRLNVPVCVDVARIVCLDTGSLDLLESPLWKDSSASS